MQWSAFILHSLILVIQIPDKHLHTLSRESTVAPNLINFSPTATPPLSAAQCKAVFFHYAVQKEKL